MKRFNFVVLSLLSLAMFVGCDKLEDVFGGDDNSGIVKDPLSEESVIYKDDVYILDDSMVDSVKIINETTLQVYSKNKIENHIKLDQIISYQDTLSPQNYFIGKIVQFSQEGNCVKINTQVPSLAEVFDQLSISPSFVQSNTSVDYIPDESDIVNYTGIVGNSIWDEIETVYESRELVSRSSNESTSLPIDLTLAFEAKSNNAFNGNIYLRLKGSAHIRDNGSYELSVTQIIGLKGSFNLASVSKQRTYIPLLAIKNGITLYSNKIVSLRLKPSFNFFYSGEIRLEAGFNYEMVNADTYVSYENGEFYNKSYENEREAYFRVKSLHTEAEFGFSLNSDLYLFIFSDSFFSGGINTIAGLGVGGEKNVGIQFPELVNFDCSVYFSPILEVKPFVAFKMPELKRIEGPTIKVKTNKFTVSLLPDIHHINYKRKSKELQVSSEMNPELLTFIDTEEDGIALFEKGATTPIAYSRINNNTRAIFDNNFNINSGKIYELAPYSRTIHEEVYGERIVVDVDPWILFYESTNGDTWTNNSNWCSNKNKEQWYGVSYSDYGYNLSLSNNNLTGDAYFYDLNIANADILTGNNIKTLTIEESYIGNLVATNTSLKNLTIKDGGVTIPNSSTLSIDNVYIENCGTTIKTRGKLGTVIVTNCGGYIDIEGSGDILKIHHQDGGADIRGNWNYIEIIGGGGGIEVYGSIGRFFCPYRGGGTCLNGVWNDWEHWQ